MIRVTKEIWIQPKHVVSVNEDESEYWIEMCTGTRVWLDTKVITFENFMRMLES